MSPSDLKVGSRLMAAFAVVAALVAAVALFALHELRESNDRFSSHVAGIGQRQVLALEARGAAMRRAVAARNLVLVTDDASRTMEKAAVGQSDTAVGERIASLKAALDAAADATPEERALFGRITEIESRYRPVALDIVGKAAGGEREAAIEKMNRECRPLLAALYESVNAFIGEERRLSTLHLKQADEAYAGSRLALAAAAAGAMLVALALGWAMGRSVTQPLQRAVTVAERVAAGDLTSRVEVAGRDETAQLMSALARMNDGLVGIVSQVRHAADGIATASSQIAGGNADLSARTEQQASALQETAASMQQMTSTVQHSTESARVASELSRTASDVAGRGGDAVRRVVETMAEISASSRRINDIIGVIDGIAFQTNVLALNAAVEAARAGEQGRGFAVVASEVRSLAQRSAQAAREIKSLIGESVERVEAGTSLVHDAGETMDDVVGQVRRMTDLMGDIHSATTEQAAGIGQVNQAVASIDQGTQQNAALVEESAAAAESLKQQAASLQQLVSTFRLAQA